MFTLQFLDNQDPAHLLLVVPTLPDHNPLSTILSPHTEPDAGLSLLLHRSISRNDVSPRYNPQSQTDEHNAFLVVEITSLHPISRFVGVGLGIVDLVMVIARCVCLGFGP